MGKFKVFVAFVLTVLTAACSGERKEAGESSRVAAVDTIPMLVMQVQKCSRLYTSEYKLHKIVTYDDTMSVKGKLFNKNIRIDLPLGKRRIAIPVNASVKAYVDFSSFSEKNVKKRGDKIEIVLPDPEVVMTATEIDHSGVRERVSFLRSDFTDEEITRIQRQGRDEILKSIPNLGIIEDARQSAARQLVPIIGQMGYSPEKITITFRKRFTINDIPGLIKKSE